MKNLYLYFFIVLCSVLSSSALSRSGPNLDVVVPCNGCSNWDMHRQAENYAVARGQKIYVSDNINGQFYVKEYYVDYVDPGSLDLGKKNAIDVSFVKSHTPQSSVLSRNLANSDAIIRSTFDNLDGSTFPVPGTLFESAFQASTNSDFPDWLTEQHYVNKLNGFDIIDAEFAKATAEARATVSVGIFSIGTSSKNTIVGFVFSDQTMVTAEIDLLVNALTGKVSMRFKNAKYSDKKGQLIPKTKRVLEDYIKNASSLEELGNSEAVVEHIGAVFNGRVEYISHGGGGTGGGGAVTICDFTKEHGVYYVRCN